MGSKTRKDVSRDIPKDSTSKSFTLVKYFTFSSITIMFLGALVLSILNTHLVRNLLLEKSEAYGKLLVENLNHQIVTGFVVPTVIQYGQIQLKDPEQFKRMDKVVRDTLHSFHPEMVNIYDFENVISYSFNSEIVGEKGLGGTEYEKALRGESSTTFVQVGGLIGELLRRPKVTRITTFAPLRMERVSPEHEDQVIGVIEIVQDVSEDYKSIFELQLLVIFFSTLVMALLVLILRAIVQRGERIIKARNDEDMRLREELNQKRHLSTIGEMTAAISHEIRNPLGIIRSSAELLKKKMNRVDPDDSISDVIIEEASRMNTIITEFLDYARPNPSRFMPCQLADILSKSRTFFAPELEKGHCTLTLEMPEGLPEVDADPDQLHQAFMNLILNAMQAMPEGGEIRIHVQEDGDLVRVLFEDKGPGLDPAILQKIREPFFTTKEKGTGLGLGIVEKIILAHGGTLAFFNMPGGGLQVVVSLPFATPKDSLED